MVSLFFLLLLLLPAVSPYAPPELPPRFLRAPSRPPTPPQEYLEVTHPLPSDDLAPSCSHLVLLHSFANTISRPPFSAPYSPLCPSPWSRVVLSLSGSSSGDQYDRISALWLGGVELLRTSTPEPNPNGIFWNVRKDITAYSSLLKRPDLHVTMMLENIINNELTGAFHVNVTFLFYNESVPFRTASGLNLGFVSGGLQASNWSRPPDVIIPVSNTLAGDRRGFWFRIESEKDVHSTRIAIPRNTARAVLELYVSFHGNDEFWYSNPPDAYIKENDLSTGRGHGSFRQVFVLIDGAAVASISPFPVIFTGGINPLFWEPVVAIGAFDLPSYKVELTPILGKILDGKEHEFTIGVLDGISYWLVDANLHLWLDSDSEAVLAGVAVFNNPKVVTVRRKDKFRGLDGSFNVKVRMKESYSGWVNASTGNLTTMIATSYKLANSVRFQRNGTYKLVKQKIRWQYQLTVADAFGQPIYGQKVKRKFPLRVTTSTLPGFTNDTYLLITNVSHAMTETTGGDQPMQIQTQQISNGWMEVKDHNVLSGVATTNQSYSYSDGYMCYYRNIAANNGTIIEDISAPSCASAS
ncbi:hypothetical protein MLD38_003640 [Melastoma candidum]|uniref:Uncharacterized protein n=1 Tax=Melastoma candidum TaxID=119954 RepID=A0ACB9S3I1_9MYRT|nr:hypothetical protein MLD38_003640 [Melastoma candidum]